jgi:two-component system sensor histidine kinase BarA
MKKQYLRGYPFSYYLIGAIFLILIIAIAGLIGISYMVTEGTLYENARTVELQTENNLVTVFTTKEEGIRIYDESLNRQMEESFPPYLAEYERSGRDPSKMDLESVKSELGGEMELYVISENTTIVYSTYAPEIGLNFRSFAPYFADYLDGVRNSEGVHPDRIVSEKSTGALKKYAYMATPDHRYILELGLTLKEPTIGSYRYLDKDLIQQVEQSNPYLEDVRVYETTLRERINDTSVDISDPAKKALLAGVLANRTSIEVPGTNQGSTTRYLFIDLKDERYGSDISRIIELNYTDQPIRQALSLIHI